VLHYARRLPHWDAIGQPRFVTFRLHGSLAATRGFRREHVATSGEAFVTMDGLLDKGATGPLHLKRPDVAGLVVEALLDSDAQFVPLAKWLGPLKGFTANQAKKPSDSVTARFGRTKVTITWCEAKKSFGLRPATRAVSLVERNRRLERRLAGMNARPTTPGKALLRGDEALADSKEDEFGGAVDIHFLHKVGAVHRNCVDAEVEESGDILI